MGSLRRMEAIACNVAIASIIHTRSALTTSTRLEPNIRFWTISEPWRSFLSHLFTFGLVF